MFQWKSFQTLLMCLFVFKYCQCFSEDHADELLSDCVVSKSASGIGGASGEKIPEVNNVCNSIQIKFPVRKTDNLQQYNCINQIQAAPDAIPFNENHPIVKAARIVPGYPSSFRKSDTITVTIPQTNTFWQSTGLFVWPGSILNVTVPNSLTSLKYKLQIGSHSDDLNTYGKPDEYRRWPVVASSTPITQTTFTVKTYTGGIIYLDAPSTLHKGSVTVTFSGQILRAPRYVLGKTTEDEWKKMAASPAAPVAEIESQEMVIVVNSSQIKRATNVKELTTWFDKVFNKFYDLSGSPKRTYKQYIVVDVQITNGFAHAGNPIMADDNYHPEITNSWTHSLLVPGIDVAATDKFESSVAHWGMYHEIGHNFQKWPWTSCCKIPDENEREVTNNIFSAYLAEIYPDGPYQFGTSAHDFGPAKRPYLDKFFTKLCFYIDLKEAFGWEAFKQFFRFFEANPSITGNNEAEVRDNWLHYFSQTVKRDITSHMQKYNRSFSSNAKSFASKYKPWNADTIVDCKTAAFKNSPCMTITKKKSQICVDMVAWVRISTSEALEITFKGGAKTNSVKSFGKDVKSFNFNLNTQALRMVLPARINPEDKKSWCATVSDQFSFTSATAKVVTQSNGQTINVPERNIEGIYLV